jgi:hypothetical protein
VPWAQWSVGSVCSVIVPASAGLDRDGPLTARLPFVAVGHACERTWARRPRQASLRLESREERVKV